MAAKRDFRVVKIAMVTVGLTASGLVYWGIAANAITEQGADPVVTALYESVQPQVSVASMTDQYATTVVVVPWPTAVQTPEAVAATTRQPQAATTVPSQRQIVVVPRPNGRTRIS